MGTVRAILCSGDVEGNTASSPGPPPAATSQVHGSPHTAPLITPRPAPPGEPEATARDARNEDAPAASRALPLPSRALPLPARELELLAAAAHGPWGQRARSKRRRPSSVQTADHSQRSEVGGIWCDSRRRTSRGLSAPRQTGRPGREATVQAHGPPPHLPLQPESRPLSVGVLGGGASLPLSFLSPLTDGAPRGANSPVSLPLTLGEALRQNTGGRQGPPTRLYLNPQVGREGSPATPSPAARPRVGPHAGLALRGRQAPGERLGKKSAFGKSDDFKAISEGSQLSGSSVGKEPTWGRS